MMKVNSLLPYIAQYYCILDNITIIEQLQAYVNSTQSWLHDQMMQKTLNASVCGREPLCAQLRST